MRDGFPRAWRLALAALKDRWLDRFTPTNMKSFSQLMHEMTGAPDAGEMVKIGREMSRWRKGVLREH